MTTQTNPILTVAQLTQAIKYCLESTFPNVTLQGEVSNAKLQSSGHFYFSLKDAEAQVSAVMFRRDASRFSRLPRDGEQVVLKGDVNVYPPSGRYQIIVRNFQFSGLGELLVRLEQLRTELRERGWFRAELKKSLPAFPKRIGIVTSPTGAAIRDMIQIVTRRASGFHLLINPVRVQGEGAATEIAQAIQEFNRYNLADVLIVGRGGGSIEDLWAFNEEIVARAIFESKIPIISAVGHETDHCLADDVADIRAPTPSAAAEIVLREKAQQLEILQQFLQRMQHSVQQKVAGGKQHLRVLSRHPVLLSPLSLVQQRWQRLDEARGSLHQFTQNFFIQKRLRLDACAKALAARNPQNQLAALKKKLAFWQRTLEQAVRRKVERFREHAALARKQKQCDWLVSRVLETKKEQLQQRIHRLQSIAPQKLLKRGYSILFSEKGDSVITSVASLKEGDAIQIQMADGKLHSQVTYIDSTVGKK